MMQLKTMKKQNYIFYTTVLFIVIASIVFVHHNHGLYDKPIGVVTEVNLINEEPTTDRAGNEDTRGQQELYLKLQNGNQKGEQVTVIDEFTGSKATGDRYRTGDQLFLSINGEEARVEGVKRDYYLVYVAWFFIFALLLVGKKQGLMALLSLAINSLILSFALDAFIQTSNVSLLFVSLICIVLFTVISLLMVNGRSIKTYAAIFATLSGMLALLAITSILLYVTGGTGLRFEEMQFLTRHPEVIFLAGVLIGALGAVMDVAITITSSLYNLFEKNNKITLEQLNSSGKAIGKDIMGTMTNILFFVYISGSIPIIIIYIKNAVPLSFALSHTISLDIARALAGGIGIVVTIPIAIYIINYLISRKQVRS